MKKDLQITSVIDLYSSDNNFIVKELCKELTTTSLVFKFN